MLVQYGVSTKHEVEVKYGPREYLHLQVQVQVISPMCGSGSQASRTLIASLSLARPCDTSQARGHDRAPGTLWSRARGMLQ